MGFKSADCAGQDIHWRIYYSSLLLMYLWQSLIVCFESLSCMSTNICRPTSCVPGVIAWCCSMLWYPIFFNLPFNWCKPPTLQLATPSPYTITEPPLCFIVGVIQAFVALSLILRSTYTLLLDRKISNFDSSVQRTLFLCSFVQYFCALAHWSLYDIILPPLQWFLDCNSAI